MSAPDRVTVDHPGATGAGGPVVGAGTRNENGDVVAAQQQQPLSSQAQEMILPSTPWTVGSTEGVALRSGASSVASGDSQQQQQQPAHPMLPQEMPYALVDQAGVRLATPSPPPSSYVASRTGGAAIGSMGEATLQSLSSAPTKSLYQEKLLQQPSAAVEAVLGAACEAMGFDIAEMWLRTGPKTHQLTNSHLRPTSLEDSVRNELVDVYYGDRSSERTHRLSPALCKRAKEAMDVVWVTAQTPHGAEALRVSISDVRTAVAVPVCHEATSTNMTIIFFSIRRVTMRPISVEFLVHMSLAAAVASVNTMSEEIVLPGKAALDELSMVHRSLSQSEHYPRSAPMLRSRVTQQFSVTGARLDLQWRELTNVEYLTDGGNSWIHTAVLNGMPVVVKTLKPECQDVVLAINEIEGELAIHARLSHPNIVGLVGAGMTSKGVRFVVLERLDGGTLSQMLGYDNRIRDRRRRFWRRKQFTYLDVLRCARSIADGMAYCHRDAIPGGMVLHRDLKPDNIGFTLSGLVKILDFGLAKVVENASPDSDDVYSMSGETGSLRYMAPEVADALPYNNKADVYSFGIILWELNANKKPFEGLTRETFYESVVHGGDRPPINKKWPSALASLMRECWSTRIEDRPTFSEIVKRIDSMIAHEKGGGSKSAKKKPLKRISGMIDRHSTWF